MLLVGRVDVGEVEAEDGDEVGEADLRRGFGVKGRGVKGRGVKGRSVRCEEERCGEGSVWRGEV
jgi:hypothetical protein